MNKKAILLADDLMSTSIKGRSRSHLIRDIAAEFGRRLNLPLRVLYVDDRHKLILPKGIREKIQKKEKESLDQLRKEMAHYPVKTKIFSLWGEPASMILKQEQKKWPLEMIVLGAHGKRGLTKALIGSVSEEVLRRSMVPVLVLGPQAVLNKYELPMDEPLRILLLTDLTPASAAAEAYAMSLAVSLEAHLTVCHSVGHQIYHLKEVLSSRGVESRSKNSIFKDLKRKSEKLLGKVIQKAEKLKIDVDSLLITDEKNLEDVITHKVIDAYDLIVMGAHSQHNILTAFVGSSARSVILNASIPVIICRQRDGRTGILPSVYEVDRRAR